MTSLRRFLAVGTIATVLDLVALMALGVGAGLRPWAADALAITIATLFSAIGHRTLTFAADPARRWYRNAPHYLAVALLALLADVAVLTLLTRARAAVPWWWLLAAKVVSLTVAFLVRALFFRRAMFASVRSDQEAPRARPPAPGSVRLSLVIPAYREADGIAETVQRVEGALGHLRDEGGFELVIVDDGSPDDTAAVARATSADQVLQLERNSGKGAAVRAGVLAAKGRTIAFTDADLSYSPDQVLGLLAQVEAGWDVVVGSRQHVETKTLVGNRRIREVGGRVINVLTSLVLLGQYRDTQCGLKAFRSDVGRMIFGRSHIDGFAFDVEMFHLVERYRFSLLEVPVELVNSSRSTVKVARDATRLVRDLFRVRAIGRAGGYEVSVADVPPSLVDEHRSIA